jgi:hypothetical protein
LVILLLKMKTPKPAASLGEDLLAYLLASLVATALTAGVGEVAATAVGEVVATTAGEVAAASAAAEEEVARRRAL